MQLTPSRAFEDEKRQLSAPQASSRTAPHYDKRPLQRHPQSAIPIDPSVGAEFEIYGSSNIEMSPFDSFRFPELTTLTAEQVDFCIGQFKACVPQLVQQNRSPFIHPLSYQHQPPNIYQDLLGVSAMYCQKVPQNQAVVSAMLDGRISSLVVASNSSSAWSIEDYLVGVQALIVYQIIRLFDGDIRQRANAERHFTMLEAWTGRLHSASNIFYNDFSSDKSLYQRWVFIESARRTVIMSVMVQAMYSHIKDGVCSSVPLLATLPMSVNGALWNMSEEDWWQSTLGFGSDLLTYQEFVDQWSGGATFQTDAFETILLVACKHHSKRQSIMSL
ncbi:hypothetical protein MMC08_006060 [Hypocenomyce scalaris]|nr:hypothetical protein [Hypocenomyce scalaris]